MNYKSILLKLSGEMLRDSNNNIISEVQLAHYAEEILQVYQEGINIAVVLGGGNIYRGRKKSTLTDCIEGDYMGMLATMINSIALYDKLFQQQLPVHLMSTINIQQAYPPYNRYKAISYLKKRGIVIIGGGIGKPCFTTDSAASLYAIELGVDLLVKGTQVDGVYSTDPKKNKQAKRYTYITVQEALQRQLNVMDMTALTLCAEAQLPIIVYNASKPQGLKNVLKNTALGTLIQT